MKHAVENRPPGSRAHPAAVICALLAALALGAFCVAQIFHAVPVSSTTSLIRPAIGVLDRAQALATLRHSPNLASVVVDSVTSIASNGDGHGHPLVLFTFHDPVWDAPTASRTGEAILQKLDSGWRVINEAAI
jgi:hypothetical protein